MALSQRVSKVLVFLVRQILEGEAMLLGLVEIQQASSLVLCTREGR
jgi:hypothetical protein